MTPFSIISGNTAKGLILEDIDGCMNVVHQAYLAHDAGRTANPPSAALRFVERPNARILALPAHLAEPWNVAGMKWIASYPDNIAVGLPRAAAVLILNDDRNGRPFACLESSVISAARTAASATLAAECLAGAGRKRLPALGIVGTGFIASYLVRFLMATGWEIDTLYAFDIDAQISTQFSRWVGGCYKNVSIVNSTSIAALMDRCELIVFSTAALRPHVHDPSVLAHRPAVLHISLRDLAPQLLLNSHNIVDDPAHVLSGGTSLHLAQTLTGRQDFLTCTLADLLNEKVILDTSKPRVFSPFGLGILDVALGKWIFDRAVARGVHQPLVDFFCDERRSPQ